MGFGIALLIAGIASLITLLGAGLALYFFAYSVEEAVDILLENIDYNVAPVEPFSDDDDSQVCKDLIEEFYQDATSGFNNAKENKEDFADTYAEILLNMQTLDV